jgi:hypothetical protein
MQRFVAKQSSTRMPLTTETEALQENISNALIFGAMRYFCRNSSSHLWAISAQGIPCYAVFLQLFLPHICGWYLLIEFYANCRRYGSSMITFWMQRVISTRGILCKHIHYNILNAKFNPSSDYVEMSSRSWVACLREPYTDLLHACNTLITKMALIRPPDSFIMNHDYMQNSLVDD